MEDYPVLIQGKRLREGLQTDVLPLAAIQLFFRENEIFDRDISIEHEGKLYRLRCNDRAFTVYRVNPHQGLPPGIPGWPVCMVHEDTIFLEGCFSTLASDHLTCCLELNDWLEMVLQYCHRGFDS